MSCWPSPWRRLAACRTLHGACRDWASHDAGGAGPAGARRRGPSRGPGPFAPPMPRPPRPAPCTALPWACGASSAAGAAALAGGSRPGSRMWAISGGMLGDTTGSGGRASSLAAPAARLPLPSSPPPETEPTTGEARLALRRDASRSFTLRGFGSSVARAKTLIYQQSKTLYVQ